MNSAFSDLSLILYAIQVLGTEASCWDVIIVIDGFMGRA